MKKVMIHQRTYIVNRSLQLTILLYSLVLATWVSLANFIFQSVLLGKFGLFAKLNFLYVVPIGALIIFSSTIMFGLILTNRIAGPIFRLRQHMDDVAEGKTTKEMEFRKADYFSDVVEPYNKIIARLKEKENQ